MTINRIKKALYFVGTFVISLAVVIFLLLQLIYQIPNIRDPLVNAGITKEELILDTFGTRIPEEKQLAFEKNEGVSFYSDSDGTGNWMIYVYIVLTPALLLTVAVIGIVQSTSRRREYRKLKQRDNLAKNDYFNKYPLPSTIIKASCTDVLHYNSAIVQPSLYLWFENQAIHIINGDYYNDIGKMVIEYDKISYFCRYGDFFTSTQVYEKSPSFGTAVAGALIGGGVGAVIASQGIVTSSTKVHDHRETILTIREEGQEKYLFFDPNAYNVFMHQIPNKEIRHLTRTDSGTSNDELVDKLAKLGELHEKGYIDEEEFKRIKADLLKTGSASNG